MTCTTSPRVDSVVCVQTRSNAKGVVLINYGPFLMRHSGAA
jgi:hypothetical protein